MILKTILFLMVFGIATISYPIVCQKVNKVKKFNFHFTFLCLGLLSLIEISDIFSQILSHTFLLIAPYIFYLYFYFIKKMKRHMAVFLALFVYLAVHSSETFFSVIISSLTGDKFVEYNWGLFYISINLIALFFLLKAIDYFKFDFKYFKNKAFRSNILKLNLCLLFIHLVLNFSHWLSNFTRLNSFSSMLATICFLMFMSTLFYLQSIREKYEKEEKIKQKKREQKQLQRYTDEIVELYNEIRGFRHDYGGMLASLQTAINTGNLTEVERVYHGVLEKANLELRSDKYTYFDLNNVGDSALRSVITQTLFKARDNNIELTFEVKDFVQQLPIKLFDLVRISSILLNNAVEGAAESFKKTMNISLFQLDSEIVLVIQNSRKKQYLDLEKIYQMGFSTKGENRGLGLSNIKEIINQYENIILDTEIEDEYFTQVLRVRKEIML